MTTTLIKTTGLSTEAATCFGASAVLLPGSGLAGRSGFVGLGGFGGSDLSIAGLSVDGLSMAGAGLVSFREERPMSASVVAEAAANHGYVYAAGAGNHRAAVKQAEQQHPMWAFRGPGPWKERT